MSIDHHDEIEPALRELADAYGVAVEYWDQGGAHHTVARPTVVAILTALHVPCSTPDDIAQSLVDKHNQPWRRVLPPVFVHRAGRPSAVWVHVPHGVSVAVEVSLETGGTRELVQIDRWVEPRWVDGELVGEATFDVPGDLPWGYHDLRATYHDGNATRESVAPLIVTPERLPAPPTLRGRTWGFMASLYSVRSRRSWGLGDLADLADLATWSAQQHGADWVLVNPLHAASPVPPMAPSPYLPVTRRFANPLYIRVEAIPEYAYLPAAGRMHIEILGATVRESDTSGGLLDRDAAWEAKSQALRVVHGLARSPGRQAAFDAFVEGEGEGLLDFATWSAICVDRGEADWPASLRDPRSEGVAAERSRLAAEVDFHLWCQWVVDEQLASAQSAARRAGMAAGIVHDLAVGVHPEGSDAWALQHVLASHASVGAPPDMYNQMGQDWSQPPWRPDALAEAGFAPYRDMLRTVLRHAGGVRIDHVLGLFRLWWIPRGAPANAGTYVRYDHEALLGILALEAARAGAFVVGEDLGTVEGWVQEVLLDRGILGTTILWFEAGDDGRPSDPSTWRTETLTSVTVHDLPPTAGYLDGEHIRIRDGLGLLTRPVAQEWDDLRTSVSDWDALAREHGLLAPEPTVVDRVVALHALAARSPARLIGIALTDAVGDVRAQNQPGTDQEYPNWRIPLCDGLGRPVLLEALAAASPLARLVAAVTSGAAWRRVG